MTSQASGTTPTAVMSRTSTTPSPTGLLAALGIAASAVLTAIGTYWDRGGENDTAQHDTGEYLITLGIIVVAVAIVFGLVVRTDGSGNPGRRAAVLGVVGLLSVVAFWAGLPMVIASGAVACAFIDKDRHGSFSTASKAGLALAAVTAVPAAVLAFTG